jgi:hypothetical protein
METNNSTTANEFNIYFDLGPAVVLAIVFGILTVMCFMRLFTIKRNFAPRIIFLFVFLFTFALARTSLFIISSILSLTVSSEEYIESYDLLLFLLWLIPQYIFFILYSTIVFYLVDLLTSSHGLYLLTSKRSKENYVRIEIFVLTLIFVFHAALIIIWAATMPWDSWVYLTQFILALTQVICSLIVMTAILSLKVYMHIRGLSTKDNRRGFLQMYVTFFVWIVAVGIRGFVQIFQLSRLNTWLLTINKNLLYWALLTFVYLVCDWLPVLLLLDSEFLANLRNYTFRVVGMESLEPLLNRTIQNLQRIIPKSSLYVSTEKLGEGSFGVVYKGRYNDTVVAVKMVKHFQVDEIFVVDFCREVETLGSLAHPNIVKFVGVCIEPPHLCIVTEFVERGSLRNLLTDVTVSIDEKLILKMALDICKAMTYLHQMNIIHRDLKSDNLLVTLDWSVKVADFGLAKLIRTGTSRTLSKTNNIGTIAWVAPEGLRGRKLTSKSDVYSFGIVLWEMFTRQRPYQGKDFQDIKELVLRGGRPDIPSTVPSFWKHIIQSCLQADPSDRPTFEELRHRFESSGRSMNTDERSDDDGIEQSYNSDSVITDFET